MTNVIPTGYFKNKYPLSGRDWIRRIDAEDRSAFVRCGLEHGDYGRMGGAARAATAYRDKRGRFTRSVT